MGFMNVFSRFIYILFAGILWFFLFVSILSYAGFAPFGTMIDNPQDTYFGFSSLLLAIEDVPSDTPLDIISFFFNGVLDSIEDVSASWEQLTGSGNQWFDYILNALNWLANIWLVWMNFWYFLIELIASPIIWFFQWIGWFAKVLGGYYNLPIYHGPAF